MGTVTVKKQNKLKMKTTFGTTLGVGWSYPVTPTERLAIWQRTAGIWKHKKNLVKELKIMRREWDRKLV